MITRIKLAWHVFRGRPLVYRVKFHGRGVVFDQMENVKIIECVFVADPSTWVKLSNRVVIKEEDET